VLLCIHDRAVSTGAHMVTALVRRRANVDAFVFGDDASVAEARLRAALARVPRPGMRRVAVVTIAHELGLPFDDVLRERQSPDPARFAIFRVTGPSLSEPTERLR
jgi:hypothetical protein